MAENQITDTVLATATCSNPFLEEDGYCCRCGQNHLKIREQTRRRQVVSKPVTAPKPKALSVREQNMLNPIYRTIYETVELVAELYEVENVTTVFRNTKGSSHEYWRSDDRHTLKFSYRQTDAFAEHGYYDYRTVEYLVPDPRPQGVDAAKMLALHEAAHMVVASMGLRRRGDAHGSIFQHHYSELIKLFM